MKKNKNLINYEIVKFPSGLELHLLPYQEPYQSTYVEIVTDIGSINLNYLKNDQEISLIPGIAHFFEHKIFANEDGDHFAKLTSLGASANAYTALSKTAYTFTATSNITKLIKELLNMLSTPFFTDENVLNEQDIIIEELNMYENFLNYRLSKHLIRNMFHNNPIIHDGLGSNEDIKTINKESLFNFYEDFYHFSDLKIVVAGKMDKKEIIYMINQDFGNLKPQTRKKKLLNVFEPLTVKVNADLITDKVMIPKLLVGIKLLPIKENENELINNMKYSILAQMLFGKSSSNYEQLSDEKLINHSFSYSVNYESGANFLIVSSDSNEPQLLKERILNSIFISNPLFKLNDFSRTKKSYLGNLIFRLNDLDDLVYYYTEFLRKETDINQMVDLINQITFNDILELYKSFQANHISTLIVKPE